MENIQEKIRNGHQALTSAPLLDSPCDKTLGRKVVKDRELEGSGANIISSDNHTIRF